MLIIKLFVVLTSVALLINIFMRRINNIDEWLKIFSKMYGPQIKHIVLEAKILFSITPEHLVSGQCSIHVVDQFKIRESICKGH